MVAKCVEKQVQQGVDTLKAMSMPRLSIVLSNGDSDRILLFSREKTEFSAKTLINSVVVTEKKLFVFEALNN